MLGPVCAGVSPGNMLCPDCPVDCSVASLSGALVAMSWSAMMVVVCEGRLRTSVQLHWEMTGYVDELGPSIQRQDGQGTPRFT